MSTYWHSILVPLDPLFVPPPERVQRFMDAVVALGAFGGAVEPMLLDFDHPIGSIEGRNPMTGKSVSVPTPQRIDLASSTEIASTIAGLNHYLVELGSQLHGPTPMWAGDRQPGWVAITCQAFGRVVSTSDPHEDSEVPPYGEPCSVAVRPGLYTHPYTGELFEVPGAGCASFVIEFGFGKSVLPPESMTTLALISSEYIAAARECFEQDFVEGCYWG